MNMPTKKTYVNREVPAKPELQTILDEAKVKIEKALELYPDNALEIASFVLELLPQPD